MVYIWMFPKIVGFPPKSSILIGVFHYFHHPFWGVSLFLDTPIWISYTFLSAFFFHPQVLWPLPLHGSATWGPDVKTQFDSQSWPRGS